MISEAALAHRLDAKRDLRHALLCAVVAAATLAGLQADLPGGVLFLLTMALLLSGGGALCLALMAIATDSAYRLAASAARRGYP